MWYVGGELCHHGIKGQKWGVRRYQNSDGTLTEAGKRRYSSNADSDAIANSYANWFNASMERNKYQKGTKEYNQADKKVQEAINNHQKLQDKIYKVLGYKLADVTRMVEAKTAEYYVSAMLLDKYGDIKVSELYLGSKFRDDMPGPPEDIRVFTEPDGNLSYESSSDRFNRMEKEKREGHMYGLFEKK